MRLRVAISLLLVVAVGFLVVVVGSGLTQAGVVSGPTTNHAPPASSTTIPWGSNIGVLPMIPVVQVLTVLPADNRPRAAAIYQPRSGSQGLFQPVPVIVIP